MYEINGRTLPIITLCKEIHVAKKPKNQDTLVYKLIRKFKIQLKQINFNREGIPTLIG